MGTSAEVGSGGSGSDGHAAEAGTEADRRTSVEEGRTPVGAETGGPRVSHFNLRSGVESLVITRGGLGGVGGSSNGGGGGDDRPVSPSRDPTRGKGVVAAKESLREVPVERPESVPAVGSSGHEPISKSDFAEYMGDDVLAQLLKENPTVVAAVLAAREERQRQIGLAEEEEERLRWEAEELVKETETVKRA